METGGGADGTAVGATVGVATALDELKSRGSALLVVGAVPDEVYARASKCMLGGAHGEPRRRLVVEEPTGIDGRLEDVTQWTPEWTRILQFDAVSHRSTAAENGPDTASAFELGPSSGADQAAPTRINAGAEAGGIDVEPVGAGDGPADVTTVVEGSIADIGIEIADAIEQFDAVAGGLAAAELRVAFDCVVSLLSTYDEQTVFRFLHVFANNVRLAGGMGHVRLPKPLDSETTQLLAPLFDAVVELRLDGTEAQQRWHFRDSEVASEWLPIDLD
ncbi:DUF7504 family protein [Halobellus sp. GM3]|uniref:DUF7504 family protein n=1 Tax=Halobellus sp. GM3 TaxID=3458410 RepID=UPI00403DF382